MVLEDWRPLGEDERKKVVDLLSSYSVSGRKQKRKVDSAHERVFIFRNHGEARSTS